MIRLIFIFGLAFADKLDRTYLPPPGSKFSGGNSNILEVPLEQPKLQYASRDEYFKSPHVAIGIDRVGPKESLNTYSTLNPSTYADNTFVTPATYDLTVDYSTINPDDHSSYNFHNSQNSYQNNEQPKYDTVSNDQFQTTENYPDLIQGVVKGNSFGFISKQIPQGVIGHYDSDTVSKQNIPSHLFTNSIAIGNKATTPIPTIQANTDFVSSTLTPSINYNYSSTEKPEQIYISNPTTPVLSTVKPITHTTFNSPNFHSGYFEKRPERIQAQTDREASILNYEKTITPDGYAYTFDTSNGIHGDENGVTLNGVKAKGSYSYVGDDGKLYKVVYTADEYGFQPQGDHLPTSPPIPDAILKVIEQVSKEKEAGIFDDGSYDENKYGYRKYHTGIYRPKSDYSIQKHSSSGNNNFIRHQTPNVINKKVIVDNNGLKKTGNNIESINPYNPVESNRLQNKSEIENIDIYDDTDLETGDDDYKRPPNFFLEKNRISSANINSVNNKNQIVDKQIPTTNKIGKYNDFTEDQNIPTESYSKALGYQYNPPQYRGFNKLQTPIPGGYYIQNGGQSQNNLNKVPSKPFLKPYVPQSKDENYGKPVEEADNEDIYNSDPIYVGDDLNNKNVYQNSDISVYHPDESLFRTNDKFKETRVSDSDPYTTDNGYTYQQGISDSDHKSYEPFVSSSPKTYSSTTVTPTEFTSGITTNQYKHPYGVTKPTSVTRILSPTSTASPYLYETKEKLNATDYLPYDYSSKQLQGHIDEYGNKILPDTGYLNIGNVFNNTTPRLEYSTNIPSFGQTYVPNDIYNDVSTTERNIGEDFIGPKQPQRFDPINGYYY